MSMGLDIVVDSKEGLHISQEVRVKDCVITEYHFNVFDITRHNFATKNDEK